jgi:hypothetical protein
MRIPRIYQTSGKPTREDVCLSGLFICTPFVLPAGEVCSFAVASEFPWPPSLRRRSPPESNGDYRGTPHRQNHRELHVNVSTGKSIIANVSGPADSPFTQMVQPP